MKIDFTQILVGLDSKPLKDESGKDVKLSIACINSLLANSQEDRIDGVEKLTRFALAQRINQANSEIDITTEEIAKIKELVGKFMSTLVSGSVWMALENPKPKIEQENPNGKKELLVPEA